MGRYLRLFTFLSQEEIEELEKATAERPHERAGQRRLAAELTTLVHGAHQTEQVIAASTALFGRGDLRALDAGTLDAALAEVPTATVQLPTRPSIVDLLVATGLVAEPGRRPARGRRGRGLREQRQGRGRGLVAGRRATCCPAVGWSCAAASATWPACAPAGNGARPDSFCTLDR